VQYNYPSNQMNEKKARSSVRFLRAETVVILGILAAVLGGTRAREAACEESGWPHWRGPTGNGASLDGSPPVEFGESKNLRWKVEIPGRGTASPVVMGSRVYVATAIPVDGAPGEKVSGGTKAADAGSALSAESAEDSERPPARGASGEKAPAGRGRPGAVQRFTLLAIDRATGKTLWSRIAAEVKPHEGHHPSHGFASASPFTDGERAYAHFGSRGLFCYDLEGKEVWKRTDFGQMRMRNGFGEGSSPTLHGDTIIVPWDHEGPSCLMALDKRTGKTLWKTDRDEPSCWATPLVVVHDGKAQVVVSGERFARSYDFTTGEELGRCAGQTARPLASPVAGHGLVFIGSGHQGNFLGAFRLDRRGDLQGTDGVVWTIERDTPDVPSPLLSGRRLYFLSGRKGSLSCVDAPTKEPHYSARRVEGLRELYASPVAAGGKVYLTSRDGTIVVIEDADELKMAATNRLDEGVDATPAIAGSEIFVRSQMHLYCFSRT
jgi:outer membrane protein assembly factor BamB